MIDSTLIAKVTPSRKEGGHLASIDSQEVDDYFAEKNQRVWIGGSDLNLEGRWTWSDCSRWNWTNWDKANLGGDNFWPDQPDNHTVADYQLTNANTNRMLTYQYWQLPGRALHLVETRERLARWAVLGQGEVRLRFK